MSPSDAAPQFADLSGALHDRIAATIDAGQIARVPPQDVTALLTEAVRLYSAVAEEIEREIPPIDATISATEAMVVACALLRAHRLNPFDLALWFSRTAPRHRSDAPDA
ncbi:MAG: hypothetical protein KGL75_10015 [Acidobacteriota bacterium]|nr:hypothetical protein [Acidobacteriota bacterium]